jgi:hypothetical protein
MSVYKEELRAFENVAKQQHQLFQDACDYGFWVENQKHLDTVASDRNNVKALKLAMNDIAELEEKTVTHDNDRFSSWDRTYFIAFEMDEGLYQGVEIVVSFWNDKAKKTKNVNVNMGNSTRKNLNYKERKVA